MRYSRIPGTVYVRDEEKDEELVYYVDKETSIICRSMLKSDINYLSIKYEKEKDPSRKNRNERIRKRYKFFLDKYNSKKEPEVVYFILEELNIIESYGKNSMLGFVELVPFIEKNSICDITCKIEIFISDKKAFQKLGGLLLNRVCEALDRFFEKTDAIVYLEIKTIDENL